MTEFPERIRRIVAEVLPAFPVPATPALTRALQGAAAALFAAARECSGAEALLLIAAGREFQALREKNQVAVLVMRRVEGDALRN